MANGRVANRRRYIDAAKGLFVFNGDRVAPSERAHCGKWSWKSNLVDLFRSMSRLANGKFRIGVKQEGGADGLGVRRAHTTGEAGRVLTLAAPRVRTRSDEKGAVTNGALGVRACAS